MPMHRLVVAVVLVALAAQALLFRYALQPASIGELPAAFILDRWTGEVVFLAGRNKYHMMWNDQLPRSGASHGMKLIEPQTQ